MSISCLIIEDNESEKQRIRAILVEHFKSTINLSFALSSTEAKNELASDQPDLIIADINLGDGLVFDVLRTIPKLRSKLIFTTAHSEYAIEAIKCSALSYLLKPYTSSELIGEIDKTISVIHQEQYYRQLEVLFHNLETVQQPKRIVLKNHDLIHVVEIKNILYAQADNNYTHFFCEDRKILVSKSLKTFEEQLAPYNFFRCHHSYLVNLSKIKALHKSGDAVILTDDSSIAVSSSKKKILYQLIG